MSSPASSWTDAVVVDAEDAWSLPGKDTLLMCEGIVEEGVGPPKKSKLMCESIIMADKKSERLIV